MEGRRIKSTHTIIFIYRDKVFSMTILWIELELFPAEKSLFQFIFSGEPDAESTFAKSLFLGGFFRSKLLLSSTLPQVELLLCQLFFLAHP